MNSSTNIIIALSVLVILAGPSTVLSWSLIPEISGDLLSTGRIAAKMCRSNVNDTIAQAFFDCYNEAPGIEIFEACQTKVFGHLLNTSGNIKSTCKSLYKFPSYASCLKSGFETAGLDMTSTLDLVNKCEAKVLGMN